jgi:hypothetical protein
LSDAEVLVWWTEEAAVADGKIFQALLLEISRDILNIDAKADFCQIKM